MSEGLKVVLSVLTALLVQRCQSAVVCQAGWFGVDCKFKCQCRSGVCYFSDGSCLARDSCYYGYFGPGCQYLDHCSWVTKWTPVYLLDCDDSTCNPQTYNTSVVVHYALAHHFAFFRIVVSRASSLHLMTFILNGNEQCLFERRYPVNSLSMDVVCSNHVLLRSLEIRGEGVGYLCSIHVSAGRNLALKQKTWQSSNSSTFPERGLSSHAVDGNRRNIFDKQSSCSQTGVEWKPSWEVQFNLPAIISNWMIFNRDVFMDKLSHFDAVLGYASQINTLNKILAPGLPAYNLFFSSANPSTFLRIGLLKSNDLTLCEVEAYGENACEDGTYGLRCEKTCMCNSNQSCSVVTGSCSTKCPRGTYGFKCLLKCNPNCSGDCSDRKGLCICKAGYTSDVCYDVEKCVPGKYGVNCANECSQYCLGGVCHVVSGYCNGCLAGKYGVSCSELCREHCLGGKCDFVTGNCTVIIPSPTTLTPENVSKMSDETRTSTNPSLHLCPEGLYNLTSGECLLCRGNRVGPFCNDCLSGWYGDNCTSTCSNLCADRLCDQATGACLSCVSNRTGTFCDECTDGYVGPLCDRRCSEYCSNQLCDNQTEKCYSCVTGHQGEFCNQEVKGNVSSSWMFALVIIPIIALAVMYFLARRWNVGGQEE